LSDPQWKLLQLDASVAGSGLHHEEVRGADFLEGYRVALAYALPVETAGIAPFPLEDTMIIVDTL